ncbi:methyltransferase [Mycobacterium phage Cuke]|uniref:Uncharacterized protein n=1 Tax=Mycobacterium phage Cuke TaxID=2079417 RepID=A0A2L1IWY7_9CAUD|nr:methyltransferase [Mycobacterium phage Cuke]AVD99694.1 hypothetical protein SEA_CUKE_78 [Mycobacterium phage Cuke]
MPVIKPKFDGSEMTSGFYDGPPPSPGPYRGRLKKMGLAKIGSGDNKGEDRIALVVEITSGKFKGAGIVHSLNLITSSAWAVNQFLDALTDGSEKQKLALRKLFWQKGYAVEDNEDGKMGRQFTSIGGKFKPIGKPIAFVTKMDTSTKTDEPIAVIDKFVVPLEDSKDDAGEEDSLESVSSDSDDSDDDVALADDSASDDDSSEAVASDDDDDDPWGDD